VFTAKQLKFWFSVRCLACVR